MSPDTNNFANFYDDTVQAYRSTPEPETFLNRLGQPTLIISALLILLAGLSHEYGFHGLLHRLEQAIFELVTFLAPAWLLRIMVTWLHGHEPNITTMEISHSNHDSKREMMRKILGPGDGAGVMASVLQARGRALSATSGVLGLKMDIERPPGLGNRDNSCYQNSILQSLAALDSLPLYLETCTSLARHADEKDTAQTLRGLIQNLNSNKNNGRTLWTPHTLKSMSTWTQQDAQEYFSKILDDIDKNVMEAAKAELRNQGWTDLTRERSSASQHSDDSGYQSIANPHISSERTKNPLEGMLAQRVACEQCGFTEGLSMVPFNCLTLSLGLQLRQHDLFDRLDSYTSIESIEGVECPRCTLLKTQRLLSKLLSRFKETEVEETQLAELEERFAAVELALEEDRYDEKSLSEECRISPQSKVSSTKTKQIVIARPPQSLAIHVNRSVFDPSTFNMVKNSAPVKFPFTLDLGPWCLGSKPNAEPEKYCSSVDEEQWASQPRSSMVAGDLYPSRLSGPIYELRAVVTHQGHHENGHYICYRKFPRIAAATPEATTSTGSETGPVQSGVTGSLALESVTRLEDSKPSEQDKDMEQSDWWRLSDHNVSKVDEDAVLSSAAGVFMLFYDCVDPSMIVEQDPLSTTGIAKGVHMTVSEPGPAQQEDEQESNLKPQTDEIR